MAENSKIEWTDHTFNPWVGCTKISPACDHCYAESWAKRSGMVQWGDAPRRRTTDGNWQKPVRWNADHAKFFQQHGRRQRVFCASLADVFDNQVPDEWRRDLFGLIELTPHLDWLLLTKRIGNVFDMVSRARVHDWLARTNVWIGATIANQAEADRDIPKLKALKAHCRFLSMEPLLGPVDLSRHLQPLCDAGSMPGPTPDIGVMCYHCQGTSRTGCTSIHWGITGGESGSKARLSHPAWFRSIRDQFVAAGVAYHHKQNGEFVEADMGNCEAEVHRFIELDGTESTDWTIDRHSNTTAHMVRVGKKAAGRLLDGRTWDEFPR